MEPSEATEVGTAAQDLMRGKVICSSIYSVLTVE